MKLKHNNSFEVFAKSGYWKHKILNAIDLIPEDALSKEKIEGVLKELKVDAKVIENRFDDIEHIQYQINQEYDKCPKCKSGSMIFSSHCGVEVCGSCQYHNGLGKCFCGWNVRDDVDRVEVGMEENGKFDGETWEVDY